MDPSARSVCVVSTVDMKQPSIAILALVLSGCPEDRPLANPTPSATRSRRSRSRRADASTSAFKTTGENVPSLVYATCASGCEGPAGWTATDLGPTGSTPVAIVVDGQGRPRILHTRYFGVEGADKIRYLACDTASCGDAASWKTLDVAVIPPNSDVDGIPSFTLDGPGHGLFRRRHRSDPRAQRRERAHAHRRLRGL